MLALLLAQAAQSPLNDFLSKWGMLVVLLPVMFYMLYVVPTRQAKKAEAQKAGLKKGDEVVTTAGLIGKVALVSDQVFTLELANNVKVRVLKTAIVGPYKAPAEEAATEDARK